MISYKRKFSLKDLEVSEHTLTERGEVAFRRDTISSNQSLLEDPPSLEIASTWGKPYSHDGTMGLSLWRYSWEFPCNLKINKVLSSGFQCRRRTIMPKERIQEIRIINMHGCRISIWIYVSNGDISNCFAYLERKKSKTTVPPTPSVADILSVQLGTFLKHVAFLPIYGSRQKH